MESGEEGRMVFAISSSDTSPSLKLQEGVFNKMTQAIYVAIYRALDFSIFLEWYNGYHVGRDSGVDDGIASVGFICNKIACL